MLFRSLNSHFVFFVVMIVRRNHERHEKHERRTGVVVLFWVRFGSLSDRCIAVATILFLIPLTTESRTEHPSLSCLSCFSWLGSFGGTTKDTNNTNEEPRGSFCGKTDLVRSRSVGPQQLGSHSSYQSRLDLGPSILPLFVSFVFFVVRIVRRNHVRGDGAIRLS